MQEMINFFGNVNNMILFAFSQIPRLSYRFQISENGSYSDRISCDIEFNEIQTKIENELCENQKILNDYMNTWKPLASLWELNRNIFMETYKTIGEINAVDFDQNVQEFTVLSTQLALKEMTKTINFFEVNAKLLRRLILIEIEEWQQSYLQLLKEITTEKMQSFYDYTHENGKKLAKIPENVADLKCCTVSYEKLKTEINDWKKILFELTNEFEILQKYDVHIDGPLLAMKLKCKDQWMEYLKKIEEADEILDNARDNFKLLL